MYEDLLPVPTNLVTPPATMFSIANLSAPLGRENAGTHKPLLEYMNH